MFKLPVSVNVPDWGKVGAALAATNAMVNAPVNTKMMVARNRCIGMRIMVVSSQKVFDPELTCNSFPSARLEEHPPGRNSLAISADQAAEILGRVEFRAGQ